MVRGSSVQMVSNTKTAKHYSWGDGCDGWYLLESPEMTIIQERMPAGAADVKHRHMMSRQFFYVLAGTATIIHDSLSTTLNAGDGLEIAPGVAPSDLQLWKHSLWRLLSPRSRPAMAIASICRERTTLSGRILRLGIQAR